ncbi:unnamed protein product [Diamesa serratosioi]
MKHQQVKVNYFEMLTSGITIVALIACGWVLLKLIQAIFWLPGYLKSSKNLQSKMEKIGRIEEIPVDSQGLLDEKLEEDVEEEEDVPVHLKKDN